MDSKDFEYFIENVLVCDKKYLIFYCKYNIQRCFMEYLYWFGYYWNKNMATGLDIIDRR